jgi:hypothetical protein
MDITTSSKIPSILIVDQLDSWRNVGLCHTLDSLLFSIVYFVIMLMVSTKFIKVFGIMKSLIWTSTMGLSGS